MTTYQKFINWLEFNDSEFTDEDGYFYETEAIDAFNNLYEQGAVWRACLQSCILTITTNYKGESYAITQRDSIKLW